VRHLALYDALTGLPNRALLRQRLAQAIEQAGTQGKLRRRLSAALRAGDSVARLGGDEFVVVTPAVDAPEHAMTIAQKIRDCLKPGFQLGRHELITETTLMHDGDMTLTTLQWLAEVGFGLTVDDFGTGYSSLAYLKRFPVSKLKIDRSFILMTGNPDDEAIVRTVIALARTLRLTTAEGLETPAQRDALQRLGLRFRAGLPDRAADAGGGTGAALPSLAAAAPGRPKPGGTLTEGGRGTPRPGAVIPRR